MISDDRVDYEPSRRIALTHCDIPKAEKFCRFGPIKFGEKSQNVKPSEPSRRIALIFQKLKNFAGPDLLNLVKNRQMSNLLETIHTTS